MNIINIDVINYINTVVNVKQLLKIYYGLDVYVGKNFVCPFHGDSDPSARLFDDNRIYCYSEGMQYTAYKILLLNGSTYQKLVNKLISANVDIKLHVDQNNTKVDFDSYFTLKSDINRLYISISDKLELWHKFLTTIQEDKNVR